MVDGRSAQTDLDFRQYFHRLARPFHLESRTEPSSCDAGLTLSLLPLMQQGYTPDSGVEKVLLSKVPGKPTGAPQAS